MYWLFKIINYLRRLIKRWSVKYYRQMSKHRISWSLIKLVESFSKLQLASAALTYHTIFAIVPIMSLMIAIAKGLGYDDLFVMQIQRMFEGQEIISNSLLLYANSYLSNTKVTMWLGVGIGLILLLYSVFSIFSTIDGTFNMLWNEKGRSFQKLIKTFAIVLVLALVLWWSISSIFSDSIIRELNVLVVTVSTYVLLLFAAYKYIPKTKVKAKYAALSAAVCGSIFALMQYFSYHIISSFNYRNRYGDMASLMPTIQGYVGGAVGTVHGNDFFIEDKETACIDPAKIYALTLQLLLENGAERAKEVVSKHNPFFKTREDYFAYKDKINKDFEAISYEENGNVILNLAK